ncbi:hypothetical protein GE061_000182 [Apolygus lucorum]|uniref:C2H2-type domain-containing protein n=1 Tax=Apolygus lucorum TaxID=248454 RepID=A0A8S9Y3N0_APOLU|nr:hypothetical protein GE061_000182 [Apolygus lucorum]
MLKCSVCDISIARKSNLNRHLKEVHGREADPVDRFRRADRDTDKKPKLMKCGACSQSFSSNDFFLEHIKNEHDFRPVTDEIRFKSEQEFTDWKRNVEEEHKIEFVVRSSRSGPDTKTVYYRCNRSGPMRLGASDECRKREPKLGKSCKTNLYCPAMIIAKFCSSDVVVKFCKSHFGHEVDLRHLPLPSPEKKTLAAKIASKIPFDEILDRVQASATQDNIKRVHLLTKKDLQNIVREFNLDYEKVNHSDDAVSVDAWVERENAKGDQSSVLLYKPKGVDSAEYPQVHSDQFLLIIMTLGQEEQLKLFGNDTDVQDLESSAIIESLPKESNRGETLRESKVLFANKMNGIIFDCESLEELNALRKLMNSAGPIIAAIRKTGINFRATTKLNIRKKIPQQRRFIPKKRRAKKNVISIFLLRRYYQ